MQCQFVFSGKNISKGRPQKILPRVLSVNLSQLQIFIGKCCLLSLHENICCGYSLEVTSRGTSNEYPTTYVFPERIRQESTIYRKNKCTLFRDFVCLC